MSRGTGALVVWLAGVSLLILVIVSTLSIWLTPVGAKDGLVSTLWSNLNKQFKLGLPTSGALAGLAFSLIIALAGLFLTSALISLLNQGLHRRLTDLRKGRSPVVESDHTVVLGWSSQIFTVIPELIAADASRKKSVIVILANVDKIEMEDELKHRIGRTGHTRIVCRSGRPLDVDDLRLVQPSTARSIIILNPQSRGEPESDIEIMKVLLALTADRESQVSASCRIVTSVMNSTNVPVARLAGGARVQVVDTDDVTARLVVQTARQPGLSWALLDLLNFGGNELYPTRQPALAGKTFAGIVHAFANAIPVGLARPDGTITLNPHGSTVLGPDDELIVLADDDSAIHLGEQHQELDVNLIVASRDDQVISTRTLILGWNRRVPRVLRELDSFVVSGSSVTVITDDPQAPTQVTTAGSKLRNIWVEVAAGKPQDRDLLASVQPNSYQHVIVLADDQGDAAAADSRAMTTLLHLRDMATRDGRNYTLVSEVRDDRDRPLIQAIDVDDFVVGERLISLLMVQCAENPHAAAIFSDLLGASGAEISLKPVQRYVNLEIPVSFATILESAVRHHEVAIGYWHHNDNEQAHNAAVINPDRGRRLNFIESDKIIVIAND